MARPTHNPDARDRDQIFGSTYTRPDSISAACWNRPYRYFVVRTDDERLSRLDDHPEGRIIVTFHTRHNAVGAKGRYDRVGSGTYIVAAEPNPSYEGDRPDGS